MLALDDESVADTGAGATSMAGFRADTADDCPEDHATDNNRNLLPTTNRHLLESRSTDNIDSAIARRPRFGASI